ncbi:MAG: hypothetical protein HYV09_13265 [Deltaproteobacteria bacterium]|nr:hypothetical protein [Deltaproteobacteria bacterium]
MSEDDRARELLERSANRTRERLVDTLAALDHRRHEVTDHPTDLVKYELHEHATAVAIAASSIILGIGGVIGLSVYRLATRDRRRSEERWDALRRVWKHPERIARRNPPKGSLASDLGRKVLMSALTYVAIEMTKRTLQRVLPAGEQPGHPRVVVRTLPA